MYRGEALLPIHGPWFCKAILLSMSPIQPRMFFFNYAKRNKGRQMKGLLLQGKCQYISYSLITCILATLLFVERRHTGSFLTAFSALPYFQTWLSACLIGNFQAKDFSWLKPSFISRGTQGFACARAHSSFTIFISSQK